MTVETSQMLFFEKKDDEEQPLLLQKRISRSSKKPRCCSYSGSKYRLIKIKEKGAVLMIVINTLFAMAMVTCFQNATFAPLEFDTELLTIPCLLVLLLCPIVGMFIGCFVGKYKVLQLSIYSLLVGLVLSALSVFTKSSTAWYMTLVPLAFSTICYASCVVPLTMDQLVGASGEELSFTIYWLVWPLPISFAFMRFTGCYLPSEFEYKHLVLFALSALLFIVIFLLVQCFNHLLVKLSQKCNPVKLIVQVLNYARKHRIPERRSAFTYWEEECPSRIDLGKDKYGGPFTVEEVEDVKTSLNLLSLISCVIPILALEEVYEVEVYNMVCDIHESHFWLDSFGYIFVTFSLPVYQFLVYPFFYNYIPSILKRIGLGLLLAVLANAVFSIAELYAYEVNTNFTCLLRTNEEFPVFPWILDMSHSITIVGIIITIMCTFEFIIAQAPSQVRGFAFSLSLGLTILAYFSVILHESIPNTCVFVIVISVMNLGVFVLYVIVSRRYKLRQRNDIIPYHLFAENQFESDYRQKQLYADDLDWSD